MDTLTITKQQLAAALLRWEQDARAGKTLSEAESRAKPVEQVAAENTDYLWVQMGGVVVELDGKPVDNGESAC